MAVAQEKSHWPTRIEQCLIDHISDVCIKYGMSSSNIGDVVIIHRVSVKELTEINRKATGDLQLDDMRNAFAALGDGVPTILLKDNEAKIMSQHRSICCELAHPRFFVWLEQAVAFLKDHDDLREFVSIFSCVDQTQ